VEDGMLTVTVTAQLPGVIVWDEFDYSIAYPEGLVVMEGKFYQMVDMGNNEWMMVEVILIPNFVELEGEIITITPRLTVIGTVADAEPGTIYAPFWTVTAFAEETTGRPMYTERLSVQIADNRRLSDFKRTAWRHFPRVGPIWDSRPFSMMIYDSVFYDTLEPLRQNIILVDVATPFVYAAAILVGLIASYLLTRRRKPEFATMRSLGVGRRSIFISALTEQAALCAAGTILGVLLVWGAWGYLSFIEPAIFLVCYTAGAAFSAVRAAGTDVLKILREKE